MWIKLYYAQNSKIDPGTFETGEDDDGFYIKLDLILFNDKTAHEALVFLLKNFKFRNIGPGVEWLK